MLRLTFTTGTGNNAQGKVMQATTARIGAENVRKALVETYGGFTELDVVGGWKNDAGTTVIEAGKQWVVLVDQELGHYNDGHASAMARRIAGILNQDSVLLQVERVTATFVQAQR